MRMRTSFCGDGSFSYIELDESNHIGLRSPEIFESCQTSPASRRTLEDRIFFKILYTIHCR